MATFETHGLEEYKQKLKELENEANGTLPLTEIFSSEFMKNYTNFSDFQKFLDAGDFQIEHMEDFEAIPLDKINEHIKNTTNFKDWEEMKSYGMIVYKNKFNYLF